MDKVLAPIDQRFRNRIAVLIDKLVRAQLALKKLEDCGENKIILPIKFIPAYENSVPADTREKIVKNTMDFAKKELIIWKKQVIQVTEIEIERLESDYRDQTADYVNLFDQENLQKELQLIIDHLLLLIF